MSKNNYKQKWLTALETQRLDPKEKAEKSLHVLSENGLAQSNLNLTLRQISSVTGEVAHVAKSLGNCFDETRYVAGLNFGEFVSEIDSKISTMPVHTVLRRVRDVMKVAEMRIGILTARCEELHDVNLQYESRLENLRTSNGTAMQTLMNTAWVGPNPTRAEMEEFTALAEGDYRRHDIVYTDLDDSWVERHLFEKTVLREPALVSDNGSDSEEDHSSGGSKALVGQNHRRAQVVPRSMIGLKSSHDDLN